MKTLRAAEMDYGPEETEVLRLEIIELRNEALNQGDFVWAVKLSHVIALLASMKAEIWAKQEA